MEIRRDILWRVYLSFLAIVAFCVVILARLIYIQQVEGGYWIAQANEHQQRFEEIEARRGTIYSEDGSMLSTSIPTFDIYIDFAAEGLREKGGERFKKNIDTLSANLSSLFRDRSATDYKRRLKSAYRQQARYYLLKKNISFSQYKILRTFPLVRDGRNKSGFIAEVRNKRLNPFGLLANRTIGLSREFVDSRGKVKNSNVGLEKTYDSLLRGQTGKRLVRFLGGGVFAPIDGYEIEPENGKDILTTLDVNIQDVAENALLKVMVENEAVHGTCIVMEVKTGKIKAMANLGRRGDGTYWEDLNYAIRASEPGSTFKLATMLALLEDDKVELQQQIDLEGGKWKIGKRTVYDSEQHGLYRVTVKEAFEHSSNVGMAKLIMRHYASSPEAFIQHLRKLHFDQPSGIDLIGETKPIIKSQKSRTWSATTLPWMSFGYEVLVSPLQTLMLYNAVANKGELMKPYLVSTIQNDGVILSSKSPEIIGTVCDEKTLAALRECLEGVCHNESGTAFSLFKDASYRVAGKTGTALVANGKRGYSDRIYQSSFAGYFPADDPIYSCIVVIRNKPFAKKIYGAQVAGPVFKEVADKLLASYPIRLRGTEKAFDSIPVYFTARRNDVAVVARAMDFSYRDSSAQTEFIEMLGYDYKPVMKSKVIQGDVPDVRGLGLKDALAIMEKYQFRVLPKGKGKVTEQRLLNTGNITTVVLELN